MDSSRWFDDGAAGCHAGDLGVVAAQGDDLGAARRSRDHHISGHKAGHGFAERQTFQVSKVVAKHFRFE